MVTLTSRWEYVEHRATIQLPKFPRQLAVRAHDRTDKAAMMADIADEARDRRRGSTVTRQRRIRLTQGTS